MGIVERKENNKTSYKWAERGEVSHIWANWSHFIYYSSLDLAENKVSTKLVIKSQTNMLTQRNNVETKGVRDGGNKEGVGIKHLTSSVLSQRVINHLFHYNRETNFSYIINLEFKMKTEIKLILNGWFDNTSRYRFILTLSLIKREDWIFNT